MHQLKAYSLATGLRIGEMQLQEHPVAIPFDNPYIVVLASTGSPSRNYPHYYLVLNFLRPYLHAKGYKIIQVGGHDDERVGADLDLCGRTSTHQYNWLIKNCELLLCGDTSALHIGGHYDKKIVTLFSTSDPKTSGAYFGDKGRQKYLTPEDWSPTYNLGEPITKLASIMPEKVAFAVSDLLDLDIKTPTSIYIGPDFRDHVLECIPNVIVRRDFLSDHLLIVRRDKGGTDRGAIEQLKHRPCTLVVDQPFDINALVALRQHVRQVVYFIGKDAPVSFAEELYRNSIPHRLISFLPQEELDLIKLDYVDLGFLEGHKPFQKPEGVTESTKFITHKRILSEGRVYLSYAHLNAKKHIDKFSINQDNVIDSQEFWEDLNSHYLFN